MIKINLLPKIINEKRAVRNTAMFFGVLLVAIIVAGATYNSRLHAQVVEMEQKRDETLALESKVKGIQQRADAAKSSVQPIQQKLDFVTDVLEYNTKFPQLYEGIARWTYEKVMYTSMQSDGTQVQMQMRVKTLDDLGRYLLNMYRATNLFSSVGISSLPSYPLSRSGRQQSFNYGRPVYEGMDEEGPTNLAGIGAISSSMRAAPADDWFDITVTCILKNPIKPPAFQGTSGTAEGAGRQTMPMGGAPSMSGPPPMPGGGPPMDVGPPMDAGPPTP